MKIYSNPGLGDILLWKFIHISNPTVHISGININNDALKKYRLDYDACKKYLNDFVDFLFSPIECTFYNSEPSTHYGAIKDTYLYDILSHRLPPPVIRPKEYILIHTKARFDCWRHSFFNMYLPQIQEFFKTFKSKYEIIIVGEKENVEQNIEVIIHDIRSLYSIFKNIADEDMTTDDLCSRNNILHLKSDIALINGAAANITFGYGGPLQLCAGFAKSTITFVGDIQHQILDVYSRCDKIKIHRNVESFLHNITETC